jgi:hypothetical protein
VSLEDLQADLEANIEAAAALSGPLVTVGDLAKHIQSTLWPFQQNVLAELEEMDGALADMLANAEDILQPETAAEFAAVLAIATGLIVNKLKPRLNPANADDKKILSAITQWVDMAAQMGETIEEITVDPPEPDAEDPEPDPAADGAANDNDPDGDDDGDEDDDEDDEDAKPAGGK